MKLSSGMNCFSIRFLHTAFFLWWWNVSLFLCSPYRILRKQKNTGPIGNMLRRALLFRYLMSSRKIKPSLVLMLLIFVWSGLISLFLVLYFILFEVRLCCIWACAVHSVELSWCAIKCETQSLAFVKNPLRRLRQSPNMSAVFSAAKSESLWTDEQRTDQIWCMLSRGTATLTVSVVVPFIQWWRKVGSELMWISVWLVPVGPVAGHSPQCVKMPTSRVNVA